MKFSPFLGVLAGTLLLGVSSPAQSALTSAEIEAPVLAGSDFASAPPDNFFAQAPSVAVAPTPPPPTQRPTARVPELSLEGQQYRATIQTISKDKHQFVHCKLRNGRILTGLPRDVRPEGFSLHTDALGGLFIRYDSLAENPRPVPAVGTRVKQGAQWTGIGALIAVAVPILIVFSPILYFSGWDC